MLVVTVSVWPGGEFDRAEEVARLGFANTTGNAEYANYDFVALLGKGEGEAVIRSEINAHERAQGWVPLVRRAMTVLHLAEYDTHAAPYDDPIAAVLRKGRA